jgi:hypothetical protein
MNKLLSLLFIGLLCSCSAIAQSAKAPPDAAKSIQQSQPSATSPTAQSSGDSSTPPKAIAESRPIETKIPAGTRIDIEAAYSLTSADLRPGDLISFRVIVPIKINDVIAIDKGSLVTARVVEAKRGRHWGRAGRLTWTMQDVIAVDGSRVPIDVSLTKGASSGVRGTSYAGEVATRTVVLGALMAPVFPIAPLALMQGFKRGENAILPEGKRYVVFVGSDSVVKTQAKLLP